VTEALKFFGLITKVTVYLQNFYINLFAGPQQFVLVHTYTAVVILTLGQNGSVWMYGNRNLL